MVTCVLCLGGYGLKTKNSSGFLLRFKHFKWNGYFFQIKLFSILLTPIAIRAVLSYNSKDDRRLSRNNKQPTAAAKRAQSQNLAYENCDSIFSSTFRTDQKITLHKLTLGQPYNSSQEISETNSLNMEPNKEYDSYVLSHFKKK